jgi:hypothetical protein
MGAPSRSNTTNPSTVFKGITRTPRVCLLPGSPGDAALYGLCLVQIDHVISVSRDLDATATRLRDRYGLDCVDWTVVVPDPAELAHRARVVVASVAGLDPARRRRGAWLAAWSTDSGAADRGWWTGFLGADGDLARTGAWAKATTLLGGWPVLSPGVAGRSWRITHIRVDRTPPIAVVRVGLLTASTAATFAAS